MARMVLLISIAQRAPETQCVVFQAQHVHVYLQAGRVEEGRGSYLNMGLKSAVSRNLTMNMKM